MDSDCTCGSGRPVVACCGPYLSGEAIAPTAEALMRSRYSAFCQGNVDYLMETHRGRAGNADERTALRQSIHQTEWTNLLIVSARKGQPNDKTGMVEFVATYRPKRLSVMGSLPKAGQLSNAAELMQLHEKSRFVKEDGRWFYTDGDSLPAYRPKRTQPCWCGSGQIFKRCHG